MLPPEIEIALQSIEASLETITNFVAQTAEESSKVFQVLPSQLVLFSKNQSVAFTETSITFQRILSDVLQRCDRVKELMEKSNDRVSIALMYNHVRSNNKKNDDEADVNNNNDNGESKNTKDMVHQSQQNSIRAAAESSDAAEMRTLNHLFKQISENDTIAEIFSEMAMAGKIFDDLRHDQDLAKIYQIRAKELQHIIQNAASSSSSSSLAAADQHQQNTNNIATTTTTTVMMNSQKIANDLGRLTSRMKEKWELAEADRALAEANVVALEAENSVLARRVRDLEERLAASSNAAAERKISLERERARSAKLLTQRKLSPGTPNSGGRGGGGGAGAGTSPTSVSNTPSMSPRENNNNNINNNATPTSPSLRKENSIIRSGSANANHNNNNNFSRTNLHSAASSTGGISSIHSDENNDKNASNNNTTMNNINNNHQQTTKSVLQLNSNTTSSSSAAATMMMTMMNNNNKNNSNNNNNKGQSGICIDGVELSVDLAKWITRVHRLLLKDPKAQEALFDLEQSSSTTAATQKNRNNTTSPPIVNNNHQKGKETPFAKFMREKQNSK